MTRSGNRERSLTESRAGVPKFVFRSIHIPLTIRSPGAILLGNRHGCCILAEADGAGACPILLYARSPASRRSGWCNGSKPRPWSTCGGVFKIDARPSFGAQQRFGLWQSATGLYFFDPPLEGDTEFYRRFYGHLVERKVWSRDAIRDEFARAAACVRPGDRVLDVGCGDASFRTLISHAEYVGIHPSATGTIAGGSDRARSVHRNDHAGRSDVVCAFRCWSTSPIPADVPRHGSRRRSRRPHHRQRAARAVGGGESQTFSSTRRRITSVDQAALAALARAGLPRSGDRDTAWNRHDSLIYWMSLLRSTAADDTRIAASGAGFSRC